VNVKLLNEVIRSLAKQHAFAIVAYAQGAAAMLTALLANPKLTSFLVLREPDADSLDTDSLHGVLHPTLAPYDPDGPPTLVRATRSLNAVLPQLTFIKFSLSKNPQFYQRELAAEMMHYFRSNNWNGAMPTLGNSTMLALLTRLAGGMGAWRGDPKLLAKRAEKEKAKQAAVLAKEQARQEAKRALQAKRAEKRKGKLKGLIGGVVGGAPAGAKAAKGDGMAVSAGVSTEEQDEDDSDAGGMTEGRVAELRAAFLKFDLDGSGNIDAEELRKVLKQLGSETTLKEAEDMIASVDDGGDGEIGFEEFVTLMSI